MAGAVMLVGPHGVVVGQAAQGRVAGGDRAFVERLMARMTLEEKLGQMSQIAWQEPDKVSHEERIRAGQAGSFLFVTDPEEIDRLQHVAVEESRLHIPLLFGYDVIHGFHTIYPAPLGMAASWSPEMEEKAQGMAAREASAVGVRWAFAPMVDIARDPRWGRMMEGAGEDPTLGERMAEAQVRGFQGAAAGVDGRIGPEHVMACVKHFAGYGAAEGGRDYDEANISDEQLWNVYLRPFHAAVKAGAGSVMSAYMDLNGVPASGNRFLLHEVLREDWGFKGFVVSDWRAVESLTTHGFSDGPEDAAVRAVTAGVDMEMTSSVYRDRLGAAVREGRVSMGTVDGAVRNILMAKVRLGLFERPYVEVRAGDGAGEVEAQKKAAREAAIASAVLLRNEPLAPGAQATLPLKKGVGSIAVVGALADSKPDTMGSWSLAGKMDETVTVLEGLRRKVGAGTRIRYARGVEIERGGASIFDGQFPEPKPELVTKEAEDKAFAEAVEAVRASDVAVLVMGEANNMSGEAASRVTLTLPGRQEELLEAAVGTGKPVVLVLLNGRPLDVTWAAGHVAAILEAWYPGTEGGDAVADLLFGDANPGGKLPVTWPRSVGQAPMYYSRNLTQNPGEDAGRTWDEPNTPLYRFGYGLSYTTFAVGPMRLDEKSMGVDGVLHATVEVENTGGRAGDEVVQMYTHQRAGSASRPRRELKGFARVHLEAGEKRVVSLELRAAELAFWSPETRKVGVEPGVFDVWVGTDSAAVEHATFEVRR